MAANNEIIDRRDPYNAEYYSPENSDEDIWNWPECARHWNMRYDPPFEEIYLKEELTLKGLQYICRTWGLNPIGIKPEIIQTVLNAPQNLNLLRAKAIAEETAAHISTQSEEDAQSRDDTTQRMSGQRQSPPTPTNESKEDGDNTGPFGKGPDTTSQTDITDTQQRRRRTTVSKPNAHRVVELQSLESSSRF